MSGRLEERRWIGVNSTVYAVTLSGKGQFVLAGLEGGVAMYDLTGRQLLTYPRRQRGFPVHQVSASPDLVKIYAGAREGWLLGLTREEEESSLTYKPSKLYETANDLHTLSVTEEGNLIAIGHLSPALSMLEEDGRLLWRRHPEDGSATDGQVWTVALEECDGSTLYVGSAGSGTNTLAALDPLSGELRAHRYITGRITLMAVLANDKGIVTVEADDPYSGRLVAYDADLDEILWEEEFYEPVTALAADKVHDLVAVGVGWEGRLMLLESESGHEMAKEIMLRSMINDLALSEGRLLAAATQDGNLALVNYIPRVGRL